MSDLSVVVEDNFNYSEMYLIFEKKIGALKSDLGEDLFYTFAEVSSLNDLFWIYHRVPCCIYYGGLSEKIARYIQLRYDFDVETFRDMFNLYKELNEISIHLSDRNNLNSKLTYILNNIK